MAELTNNLNNLKGKLGNVVFYERNGKTFVRSLPSRMTKKKTEKQILSQKRFAELGRLYRVFAPVLNYQLPKGVYSKNTFFYSLNSSFVTASLTSVTVEYEKLILSNYGLKELLGLEITRNDKEVFFQWKPDNLQDNSYYVLCVVYCKGLQQLYATNIKRKELFGIVTLPPNAGEIITYTIGHHLAA